MTPNIATTKEQSTRLRQCGVDPKTADMYIDNYKVLWAAPYKNNQRKDEKGFAPAWSLSAMLALLPKEIYDESDDSFYFSLAKEFPLSEEYGAAYLPCWDKGDALVRKRDNDPIEACVQLIEWLTANNYKLNQL